MTFEIIGLYFKTQELGLELASMGQSIPDMSTFGDLTNILVATGIALTWGIFFYSLFFYYGWFKRSNNKLMKLITSGTSIVWSVFMSLGIYILIVADSIKFMNVLEIIGMLAFAIPLYYYAWRKECHFIQQ